MGLQTSVTYASPIAIPGMIADSNDCDLVSAVCTSTVLPGTYVELSLAADGEKRVAKTPNSTSATLADGGVAVYDPMSDPQATPALGSTAGITGTGFPAGAVINVLRRGRIFVQTDASTTAGSAGLYGANAKVQHPSTTAASATNTGGYFTIATAVTTSGVETTAAPGFYFVRSVDDTNHVSLLEVNRPSTQ